MVARSQNPNIIIVTTSDEFVDAIGPDRTIQLKGNVFNLTDISTELPGVYFRFEDEYDGRELVISGVNNLTITGIGNKPVKMVTNPVYGDVIFFENCNNISIENIEAGHEPEKGGCTGGVFNFYNCTNIRLKKSILYGSGMEGITAELVNGLTAEYITIKGCSYSIMTLLDSKNMEFKNCIFTDNAEFDLINIKNSGNIKFTECVISNNLTGIEDYSDYALFNVTLSNFITVKNCIIKNNMACWLSRSSSMPQFLTTRQENNKFVKGLNAE
jgi:hypothetical protein